MGQYTSKRCECCKIKNATYELNIGIVFPDSILECKCKYLYKNIQKYLYSLNISNTIFNYKYCTCDRNIYYENIIKDIYSKNRDILEFMVKIPIVKHDASFGGRIDSEINFKFYGCDDCINYRPWSKEKLNKII